MQQVTEAKKLLTEALSVVQLSRPTEALKEFSERMETIYSTFVDEYAATEDKIHRIWSDILAEYHAFEVGSVVGASIPTLSSKRRPSSEGNMRREAVLRKMLKSSIYPGWPRFRRPAKVCHP